MISSGPLTVLPLFGGSAIVQGCQWPYSSFRMFHQRASLSRLAPRTCAGKMRSLPSARCRTKLFHQRGNIFRWIAGEILNTLVMSTYASLWVYMYIYIFLAQCRLYVALCSFHMWFPIHYFYPLPFAFGVLAWHWPGSSHYFRFGWHPNWFRRWAKSVDS